MDINSNTLEEFEKEFCSNIIQDSQGESAARSLSEVVDVTSHGERDIRETSPLYNPFEPNAGISHEKIEHRMVLLLKERGMTNREIARETGYTEVHVGSIINQPWAQSFMLGRLHDGADAAMSRLQKEADAAAMRLIEIAKTAKNEEVKRKANNDILDRKYGKPNQPYSYNEKAAQELTDAELTKHVKGN